MCCPILEKGRAHIHQGGRPGYGGGFGRGVEWVTRALLGLGGAVAADLVRLRY
jgi:hypothetical protein